MFLAMFQQTGKYYHHQTHFSYLGILLYFDMLMSFSPSDIYYTSVSFIALYAEHKERVTSIQTVVSYKICCMLGEAFVLFSQNATVLSIIALMNLCVSL